jgi:hypothetical protein
MTPKHRAALKTLQECRIPVQELRAEWAAQKAAQTSIRARKPPSLYSSLSSSTAFFRCPCSFAA